ncbi:MAG TPA: hypothetical protein VFV38_20545 [Ktedonobacteraceae bacterium]|nr:hypothetical protein [Ktedonobacteraceae bacterium]
MQETIETTQEEISDDFSFELEELESDRAAMILIPLDPIGGHVAA